MENASRREKFLFWLIKNSNKGWLWLTVIIVSSILTNTGMGLFIGLGVVIFGALSFAAGVNMALEATLGDDYTEKGLWKKKTK
jgi:hypothetical protein